MVLLDDVGDPLSQTIFSRQLQSVLDMGDEDKARHTRCKMIMFILEAPCILNEVKRFLQLSNVMVIGTDPRQQRVGCN